MKEFSIFIRQGSGTPYYLKSYEDIYSAKKAIFDLVSVEEDRNRMYFVDNDFFDNKYFCCSNLKYMCVKVREVSEWETYSEKEKLFDTNKIVYLNFKK